MHEPVRDHLLNLALRALEASTGIRCTGEIRLDPDGQGIVHLMLPAREGSPATLVSYTVVVREFDRAGGGMDPGSAKDAKASHSHILRVLPRISDARGLDLRKRGLPYLDAGGNAYLQGDNHFVLISGRKAPDLGLAPGREGGVTTVSALKVIFTVLCDPAALNASYRDIAKAAGVALGAIGPILDDLARRRFTVGKKPDVQLVDPRRLLDEWVTNYPTRLRPKLRPRRFSAYLPDWRDRIDLRECGGFWGAEIAADRYTRYLKPATATIYLPPEPAKLTELVTRARLRPDPTGDIEVLDAFWTMPTDPAYPDLAPRVLVYADLLASLEPRNIEVARLLYQEQIADAFGDTQKAG